jgi:hypothetical protein
MVKMIEIQDGTYVHRSDVVAVRVRGKDKCVLVTRDGKTHKPVVEFVYEVLREFERDNEPIPAQPGYFAILASELKNGFHKLPIVGWIKYQSIDDANNLDVCFWSQPIVAGYFPFEEFVDLYPDIKGIQVPDGRVIDRYTSHIYESLEAFKKRHPTAEEFP